MNTHRTALIALASCLAACSPKAETAAPPAEQKQVSESPGGRVTLPVNSPKLRQIHVDAVQLRNVPVDEVLAPGKIDVNPNRVSRVTLPVTGRVVSTLVRIGDSVRQGQVVLLLESSEADAAMATALQATSAVTLAKSGVIKAQADRDRARDLFAGQAIPQKDVFTADAALAQAQSTMEQADASREQAEARLQLLGLKGKAFHQRIEVRAPVSGKVLEMSVVQGEYRNDTSAPVLTIADLSSVLVVSDVPESSIRMIRTGERLEVELTAYPDRKYEARVTRLGDAVDPATRTIKVYAQLENPGGNLKPEMFARVRHVNTTHSIPVIPATAVVQAEGQAVVYREVASGTYEPVPVTLGNRIGDSVGVLTGLQAQERIVVDGAMLLRAN